MYAKTLLVAGAFYVSFLGYGHAASIVDNATKAERLLESGDTVGALEALDAAVQEVWETSPLRFRKAIFVDSVAGYGVYRERNSSTFKQGEALIVYAEPVAFSYGNNGIVGYDMSFETDFVLTDKAGKTVVSRDNFLKASLASLYRNREFHLKFTVTLTGLPVGEYIAKFHVRDVNSTKAGDFELPFEVVE